MVRYGKSPAGRRRGSMFLELVISLGILVVMVSWMGSVHWQEQNLARDYYYRAVAMQVVDGEMEALVAGEWKAFRPGDQPYTPRAEAAKNLPPGRLTLTVGAGRVKLEWVPTGRSGGGRVMREAKVR